MSQSHTGVQVSDQYERKLVFIHPFQAIKGIGQPSATTDISQASIPFNSLMVQVTLTDLKQPTGHPGVC